MSYGRTDLMVAADLWECRDSEGPVVVWLGVCVCMSVCLCVYRYMYVYPRQAGRREV